MLTVYVGETVSLPGIPMLLATHETCMTQALMRIAAKYHLSQNTYSQSYPITELKRGAQDPG